MPGLILRSLAELAAFGIGAYALGSLALRTLGGGNAPLRVLVGLGLTGYVTIVLALAHVLHGWTLLLVGVAAVVAARDAFASLRLPRGDRVTVALGALAGAMACGEFLAALAPPEASDELAYHLPIAEGLRSDAVHQLFHADGPYANFPLLGDAITAAGLTVHGPALAHALQFAVLLAFVAFAATIVRDLAGSHAGAAAAVALLAYPGLTYNATTAYVDATTMSFELAAVLLVVRWLHRGGDLRPAAVVLGLALSVKYTPLFTAAVLAVTVAVVAWRRHEERRALTALAIVVAACGFWYAKNLIRFGNPFWPFYLGHRGMADDTYDNFVAGIHAFGPRTVHAFVEVPWLFASDVAVVPFLALSLVVLALAMPRARALAAYALLYVAYWFWFASHQVRFVFAGAAAAILAVVVATATGGRALRIVLACAAVAAVAVAQARIHPFSLSAADDALAAQFGSPKALYALGLESRREFEQRYFGCVADAVAFLDAHPSLSPVLVPQTALAPGFARRARFGKLPLEATSPERALRLARRFRSVLRLPSGPTNWATTEQASEAVTRHFRVLWKEGECAIFRLVVT